MVEPRSIQRAQADQQAHGELELPEVQKSVAPTRPQWKIEAEKKAALERQRAAEAKRRAQQEAAAKKREELERQRIQARQEAERKAAAQQLLKQIEEGLNASNVAAAEQAMAEYEQLLGVVALKSEHYQGLRKELVALKQMLAELEQAAAAEQFMQQLMVEAEQLEQSSDTAGAETKYREVLALNPQHSAAMKALAGLMEARAKPKPATRPKKEKVAEPVEKGESSYLGQDAEGWIIQVATYPEEGKREAYALLGALRKARYRAVFVKKQELAGRLLYRVRVGAYGEKSEAKQLQLMVEKDMALLGIKVSTRVIRQKQ